MAELRLRFKGNNLIEVEDASSPEQSNKTNGERDNGSYYCIVVMAQLYQRQKSDLV